MADYYPLIARSVAAVKDAPVDERAQVYERARTALVKHLRATQPPLGPDVIAREEMALDDAIARVETEILSGEPVGASPDPEPDERERPIALADSGEPAPVRRPPAPAGRAAEPSSGRGRRRLAAIGLAVGAFAAVIAGFAIVNREDPARYAPSAPASAPADPAAGPKLGARVSGPSGDPAAASGAPSAPTQASAPAQNPVVAVAQRAILYEQRPETPNDPAVVIGRAIWRLDTAPSDQGQAADTVVRIDLEFPERAMSVEMTIRRNTEPALQASHLFEIKFNFRAGGGPVKDLASPPTMKGAENERGSPLIGLQVPVMENYFLVGLSNATLDVERNLAQLQSANWIDLPFRFANDRIGVIAIEKGVQGGEVMQAALARWR